jgi:hypothetical protein
MVDGVLPDAWVRAEVSNVKSNYARADLIEKLEGDPDELGAEEEDGAESDADDEAGEGEEAESEEEAEESRDREERHPHLGSRENFWGS